MRTIKSITLIVAALTLVASACASDKEAAERARKEAEALDKATPAAKAAPKVNPPVPGGATIPCEQLIDLPAFQAALAEKEPLELHDITKADAEAVSVCAMIRGGKHLTAKEQEKLAKKTNHKLGVLPGDELCRVTAYCWTIETPDAFKEGCKDKANQKFREDDSMGTFACTQVIAQGADDVNVFHFFDEDTKCILKVGGGPANTDNDSIRTCAKTARDTIDPSRIAVGGSKAEPAAPSDPPANP
ncbi:MAG: hypothetical protein H6708_21730 [Kofleriaceae bacterium]|nr:hypothetical protein [Kofleriaceae bacterium]